MVIFKAEEGMTCPDGWTKHEGQCYEFFAGGHYWRSWTGANELCTQMGANLINIKDKDIQAYITGHNVNLQRSGVSSYWIGLSSDEHAIYEWTDGSSMFYNEFWSGHVLSP